MLYKMRRLRDPKKIPLREPDRITLDIDVLEYRKIPGVGSNDEEDNGVLYYYDEPIMFVAFIEGQQVVVTLLDQDYANDGMENHFAKNARGWDEHIAFPVDNDLLRRIYENKSPLRALWEQTPMQNYFLHKDWVSLGEIGEGNDHYEKSRWYSVYRVWKNVPVKDSWKPEAGCTFDPKVKLL